MTNKSYMDKLVKASEKFIKREKEKDEQAQPQPPLGRSSEIERLFSQTPYKVVIASSNFVVVPKNKYMSCHINKLRHSGLSWSTKTIHLMNDKTNNIVAFDVEPKETGFDGADYRLRKSLVADYPQLVGWKIIIHHG